MNDLINRQDAIDEIREYLINKSISDDELKIEGFNSGINTAIEKLSTIQSAQPEQKPEQPESARDTALNAITSKCAVGIRMKGASFEMSVLMKKDTMTLRGRLLCLGNTKEHISVDLTMVENQNGQQ